MPSVNKIQQAEIVKLDSPERVTIKMGDWTGTVDISPDYFPRGVGDICWVRIDDAWPGHPHLFVLDKVRPEVPPPVPVQPEPDVPASMRRKVDFYNGPEGAEPDERDVTWELAQAEYATRTYLKALRGALAELDRVRAENEELRKLHWHPYPVEKSGDE